MKRKDHNKCYRACVVTLIIMFRNIYQILSNHTSQTFVNNQSICYITRIQGINTLDDTTGRPATFLFYQTREKIVYSKTEFTHL